MYFDTRKTSAEDSSMYEQIVEFHNSGMGQFIGLASFLFTLLACPLILAEFKESKWLHTTFFFWCFIVGFFIAIDKAESFIEAFVKGFLVAFILLIVNAFYSSTIIDYQENDPCHRD